MELWFEKRRQQLDEEAGGSSSSGSSNVRSGSRIGRGSRIGSSAGHLSKGKGSRIQSSVDLRSPVKKPKSKDSFTELESPTVVRRKSSVPGMASADDIDEEWSALAAQSSQHHAHSSVAHLPSAAALNSRVPQLKKTSSGSSAKWRRQSRSDM
jgi:hypothetical protein